MALSPQLRSLAASRRSRIRRRLLSWTRHFGRGFAWRDPGRSAYEVLIAEILLKRTTATAAARVYPQFIKRFPNLLALSHAKQCDLEAELSTLGLQTQRAKAIKLMAEHLTANEGGQVPSQESRLRLVPALGAYSTAAIRSFVMNQPAAIVDSNVTRILRRIFASAVPERPTQGVIEALAAYLLPLNDHKEFNFGLLDLGALVCRYVRPRCSQCPLVAVCDYGAQV